MEKQESESASLSANERLQGCAERARQMERLVQEAHAEVARLRKEAKRTRKAYRKAKEASKDATKAAIKARDELRICLESAFRDLATTLQNAGATQPKSSSFHSLPLMCDSAVEKADVLPLPSPEIQARTNASA